MRKTTIKPVKIIIAFFLIFLWGMMAASTVKAQVAKTYDEAIRMGDKNSKQKKWLDAKAYYQMALKFKKKDTYALKQVEAIVKKLNAQMALEEKYSDLIDRADDFFDQKEFDAALKQYKAALALIPNDDYAQGKVKEIVKIKKDKQENQALFKKKLSDGELFFQQRKYEKALTAFQNANAIFPNQEHLNQKIKKTKILLAKQKVDIKKADKETMMADRYLLIKNYTLALVHYQKADSLLPNNPNIALKINEIKPKAEKQQAYNKKTEEADNLYIAKNYLAARAQYNEASKLWPENSYPSEMVSKIDGQINKQKLHLEKNYRLAIAQADSLYTRKEYDNAKAEYNLALTLKPSEKYPQQQLQKIKLYYTEQKQILEKNYHSIVASADSLFNLSKFKEASEKYNLALQVKPDDPYPVKQLASIKTALKKRAAEQQITLKYQSLVAKADLLFDSGQYHLSLNKYQEARALKSSETYPKEKIKKINAILTHLEEQKVLDKKYKNQMVLATRLVKEKKYQTAKKTFHSALAIKPDASLPKQKIAEIDSLLAVKAAQEKTDKAYQNAIHTGDSLLSALQYENALASYTAATKLKPDEKYARQKLQSVAKIMAAIAKEKQTKEAYDQSIRTADQWLKDKKYELAKTAYQKALTIKAGEAYPKQKIGAIDKILVRLEKEKEQRYQQAMTQAENLFSQKSYTKALIQYKVASSIEPNQPEPIQQIDRCNGFIAVQIKKLKTEYNLAVADADKFYAAKIYDRAIKAYERAGKIKPDETYPSEMIAKITRFIETNAITDVIKEPLTIAKGETKKFTFDPLPIKVRKSNYLLVKAKNKGKESFKIMFTFGSKKGKNGGFVVQIPNDNKSHDFIVRVGNQYKWFSDDNNWIAIYPEGGAIEISLLRISKSN